jgi:dolichol-phosphate mannosyltransferase
LKDNELQISVVVPVYNEDKNIQPLYRELNPVLQSLTNEYEIIFVDDGSTDGSKEILLRLSNTNKKVKVIHFSKNFGHEAAMTAGIDYSKGDAVICMDADLQHPPHKLNEMVQKFREGYQVVNMVRKENIGAGKLKNFLSFLFYRMFNMISANKLEPNASDFFLISRKVANSLIKDFRERTRFLRGFIQIVGFRRTKLEFVAPDRVAGESTYSMLKLFVHAINAMITFTNLPLRLGILLGSIFGIFSSIVGIYSIIMKLSGYVIPGYTTIVVMISFLFAIQFFITGIIGEYIGYIFTETKKRPIYIVQSEVNVEESEKPKADTK